MNLILVNSLEAKQHIKSDDRRAVHIRKVLLPSGKKTAYVGLPNGPIGLATLVKNEDYSVSLDIDWNSGAQVYEPFDLTLLVGLCRPQTCRKMLRDFPVLGIRKIVFFEGDKAEPSYRNSSLWKTQEWQENLHLGLEQSFNTFVPTIAHTGSLRDAFEFVCQDSLRIALDPYTGTRKLEGNSCRAGSVALAIGPERGWSEKERGTLSDWKWDFRTIGPYIMRTETAVVAACSIVSSGMESAFGS